jgi:hypothetical protein
VFDLTGCPAGITKGNQEIVRLSTVGDCLQDVARTGEAQLLVDYQRRLPVSDRPMQDKAAVGLYRPTQENRQAGKARSLQGDINSFQKRAETHVQRPIDDHAERAAIVVFGDVDQGPGKIRIYHCRHGNEKMVSKIDALHGPILIGGGG